MARECYKEIRFKAATLAMIDTINAIVAEYLAAGYTLTVRQLYYQLVARAVIPNTEKSYKSTASIINDARIAGLIDWDAIEDRTRAFNSRARWQTPHDIVEACARQYHNDPWENQDHRIFLIVEKEALVGVFQRVCHEFDVPLLAARGYPSASVVREFVQRELASYSEQNIVILHFGDHDPSGIDMSRDLTDRFDMFTYGQGEYTFKRMALNLDQVQEYKPPPNPAKMTDSRFVEYKARFGTSSWELDALQPNVLASLARHEIEQHIDPTAWKKWQASVERDRKRIKKAADSLA
jgi:hypothetical protein